MNSAEKFKYYKQIIEDNLDFGTKLVHDQSKNVGEAMLYSLSAGGKRLRPALVMSACEFAGGKAEDALVHALAIEYIHTYSLLHDDLPAIDNDDLRRGRPTNHKVFGEAMAILAGDALLNTAMDIMLSDTVKNIDCQDLFKRKVLATREISRAAGVNGMIGGQVADVENEGKKASKELLQYIHENKTGAMIVGAVRAGAFIGGTTEEELEDLTRFASYIGLAFQIRDDILDIEGDAAKLGKNIGRDIELEKSTYPVIYGMEESKRKFNELNDAAINILEKYGERATFFIDLIKMMSIREK
ncbi:MAG: farnesyl diphosphate synthase [Gallibacter sp.]|nr:farnesyl diphosphate synthase [Gallibacter sp.]